MTAAHRRNFTIRKGILSWLIIKVEVSHGNTAKKFPVYEIYLDGVIVTKVSDESDAMEMVSRWQEIYK